MFHIFLWGHCSRCQMTLGHLRSIMLLHHLIIGVLLTKMCLHIKIFRWISICVEWLFKSFYCQLEYTSYFSLKRSYKPHLCTYLPVSDSHDFICQQFLAILCQLVNFVLQMLHLLLKDLILLLLLPLRALCCRGFRLWIQFCSLWVISGVCNDWVMRARLFSISSQSLRFACVFRCGSLCHCSAIRLLTKVHEKNKLTLFTLVPSTSGITRGQGETLDTTFYGGGGGQIDIEDRILDQPFCPPW